MKTNRTSTTLRTSIVAICALAGFLATTGASAQRLAQATIPFSFHLGNATLPAGSYVISRDISGVISIRNFDRPSLSVLSATTPIDEVRGMGGLIFNKYGGDGYFLSRIQDPGGINVALPESNIERRVRTREARMSELRTVLLATN